MEARGLKIDLEGVAIAFDDASGETSYVLDLETGAGAMVYIPSGHRRLAHPGG